MQNKVHYGHEVYFYAAAASMTSLFMALKITKVISWSWWVVMAPALSVPAVIILLLLAVTLMLAIFGDDGIEEITD